MALVNYATREINAKIVYYGPGLSGKTTNIQYIFKKVQPKNKGKLISLSTQGDRTLFFDFLPVELGSIKGFKTRFHLYTVPGQVFYNSTRKMVLKGADGVVFVADSQAMMREENIQSLDNLKANLAEMGLDIRKFPVVIQYNKRDIPDCAPIEEMNGYLNRLGLPHFEASALSGDGVLKTLTSMVKVVLQDLNQDPNTHSLNLETLEKPEERKPGDGSEEPRAIVVKAKATHLDMPLEMPEITKIAGPVHKEPPAQAADPPDTGLPEISSELFGAMAGSEGPEAPITFGSLIDNKEKALYGPEDVAVFKEIEEEGPSPDVDGGSSEPHETVVMLEGAGNMQTFTLPIKITTRDGPKDVLLKIRVEVEVSDSPEGAAYQPPLQAKPKSAATLHKVIGAI